MFRTGFSAVLFVALVTSTCLAQPPQRIRLNIEQTPDAGGGLTYSFSTSAPNPYSSLLAPGGHQFGPLFGAGSTPANGLSFSDIENDFFGTWTLNYRANPAPPTPIETYEFDVTAFSLDDVFNVAPTMVTPLDGATVGNEFLVDWEYPAGVTPPNSRAASVRGHFGVSVDFGEFDETSVPISLTFDSGVTSSTFTLLAGSRDGLNDLVSTVRPVDMAAPRNFNTEFAFNNFTAPVRVTALNIPEPSAIALTAFAAAGLIAAYRRRR